jgi:hypothetical protein
MWFSGGIAAVALSAIAVAAKAGWIPGETTSVLKLQVLS